MGVRLFGLARALVIGAVVQTAWFEIYVQTCWSGEWSIETSQESAKLRNMLPLVGLNDISINGLCYYIKDPSSVSKVAHVGMGKSTNPQVISLLRPEQPWRTNVFVLEYEIIPNLRWQISTRKFCHEIVRRGGSCIFPYGKQCEKFLFFLDAPLCFEYRSMDYHECTLYINKSSIADSISFPGHIAGDFHFVQLPTYRAESEPGEYGGNGRGRSEHKRPPDESARKFLFSPIAIIALSCGLGLIYEAIYMSISYGMKNRQRVYVIIYLICGIGSIICSVNLFLYISR
jgi:hypothetical protein